LKKSILLVAFLALSTLTSIGVGSDSLTQDAGSWAQVVGEGSLHFIDPSLDKARIWLEGQSRWDDNWNHWYQGAARIALGYSLSERATVWAGYTWVPTQNLGKAYVSQQDVWPGFRYVLPTDYGTWMFRILLESNFIRGSAVRLHPRQLIRFAHSFTAEPRLSLIVWDEFMFRVNTTPYGGQAGYDQNRAFLGAGWTFSPYARAELGYLNQDVDGAFHQNNLMRHLILGSLFFSF
jgi:hypothetical protein